MCGIRSKLWRILRASYIQCLSAVSVGGSLSKWFELFQGVQQGAVLSMLLYICFINALMKEVHESNLGSHVLSLNTSCIGYADDLAFTALSRQCMQRMINIAFNYSCRWRFNFSAPKCAVMIYGKALLPEPMKLGTSSIKCSDMYTHVGVPLVSKGSIPQSNIQSKIDSC